MKHIVWTIAGSDSSGGAGIQADIKAMHSFGVQGCSVITALTAQNSLEVAAINAVSTEVLDSQLLALSHDLPAAVIKIGMLANVQQVQLISEHLSHFKRTWQYPPQVVYDPVMLASSGDALTDEDILDAVKTHLLPLVDVITPNTQEVQTLTGVYLIGASALQQAAKKLQQYGVKSVVIKGGHWDFPQGYCVDYCLDEQREYWLGNEKLATPHSHGTGCSFASSIAACLAQQYPLKDAFILAKAYINHGLSQATRLGEGIGALAHTGFPSQLELFPQVIEPHSWLAEELALDTGVNTPQDSPQQFTSAAQFAPCLKALGVYAVVDSLEWLKLCLENGLKTVQLRIKVSGDEKANPQLEQTVIQAVLLGQQHQAQVFINDHWQLAIKHRAYGVHLGQEDLHHANLAAIKQAGLRLGISTHGFYEMLRAHNYRPSYMAFGAIYPTTTKDMTGQIQGLDKLTHFVPLMQPHYPTVAIGGINLTRASEVLATGVDAIAVVRAITQAKDPATAILQLQQCVAKSRTS